MDGAKAVKPAREWRAPILSMERPRPVEPSFRGRVVRSTLTNVGLSVLLKALLFVQSVILARLFAPTELGLFTTALMTVSLAMLFGHTGADQAIVRHQGSDDEAMMDTAMTINLVIGLAIGIVVFLAAPLIAWVVGRPDSADYIRFLSCLTLGSAFSLPSACLVKRLQFGRLKLPPFIEMGVFLSTTIILLKGFDAGIWSLFYGRLAGFAANYGSLWILAPYRPRLRFDASIAVRLAKFGWPLLVSAVTSYLVWQGDQWLVLYFWGPEQLAYYVLAFTLPFYLKELVDLASATFFPLFARVQRAREKLSAAFSESNRYLAVLTVPGGVALWVFAPSIIHLVYTDTWAPAAALIPFFAAGTTISVIAGYNWGSLTLATGKTKYLMYVNLWTVCLLATLGAFMIARFGPLGGALFMLIQISLTIIACRLPIIYREIRSLVFLARIWKPVIAGIAAGMITHAWVLPRVGSIPLLLLGMGIFAGMYLGLLTVLDRHIIRDMSLLFRSAFVFRSA